MTYNTDHESSTLAGGKDSRALTSHLKMSSSSIRPAEKPSTGFLLSSASCLRSSKPAWKDKIFIISQNFVKCEEKKRIRKCPTCTYLTTFPHHPQLISPSYELFQSLQHKSIVLNCLFFIKRTRISSSKLPTKLVRGYSSNFSFTQTRHI